MNIEDRDDSEIPEDPQFNKRDDIPEDLDLDRSTDDKPADEEEPGRIIDEVPETENITEADVPDPSKDEVEAQALEANSRYWDLQDLVFAGRLSRTEDFLPGREVRLHTPDQGEIIWIGKRLDQEFGKLDPRIGVSSSYDDGIKLITLSVVVDDIDGEPVFSPASDIENPLNPNLSFADRELAIERKSMAVRKQWQYYYSWTVSRMYEVYRELLQEQEEALKLLPFYSRAGALQISARKSTITLSIIPG